MRADDPAPHPGADAPEPTREGAEDATREGDAPFTPGTALAALRERDFRTLWLGSVGSNMGTWMQNVALGVFGYELTGSSQYVALLGFAHLGPLLVFATLGGALADVLDRRRLLVWCQAEQLVASLLLALAASADDPSELAVFLCVLLVGIGNAINAPAQAALLPALVSRENLAGAVSLQSVQMNVSRVAGPAIGGVLLPSIGASGVFVANAVTYVFVIAAVLVVHPSADLLRGEPDGAAGWRRLVGGFRVARHHRVVRRVLLTMASMSFFALPFVGLMPVLADRSFGIDPESTAYGLLYATFGLGAALGAVAVGTVLVGQARPRMARLGLGSFAAALAAFALVRSPAPAYPMAFLVGFTYFTSVTSLSTHLQESIDNAVRGRVMALWIMSFGGVVPIGLLVGGFVAERTSITAVVLFGAAFAALLALVTDVRAAQGAGDMVRRAP